MFEFSPKPPATVDGVMAAFSKTIDQLKEVSEREKANAYRLNAESLALKQQALDAEKERHKADSVAAKLQSLLTV
jgi:hypothetical protein